MSQEEAEPRPGYLNTLAALLKSDAKFHTVVAAYGIVALALALYLQRPEKMLALMYARRFAPLALFVICMIVAWNAVKSLKADSPLRIFIQNLREIFNPDRVSRLILFGNIALFYGIFTSIKRMLSDLRSFDFDNSLAQIDEAIHFGDPWTHLYFSQSLTRFIQFFYLQGWLGFLVLYSFFIIMTQPRKKISRYLICFYIIWIVLGNLVAGAFMSAGPVYIDLVNGDPRFLPLLDRLDFSYGTASSSIEVQDRLWEDRMLDLGLLGSGISAFPSLHVAMATLWMVSSYSISRPLAYFFALVLLLIQFSSVYLAWHYAVDGYFSFLAVLAIWLLVGRYNRLA